MRNSIWGLSLFLAMAGFFAHPTYAQQAYGLSQVTYDASTNTADSISETELDYTASYYYDPYVEGYLFDEADTSTAIASGYSTSQAYANCVPSSIDGPCLIAYVSLSAQAVSGHNYDLESDHYVIAYYQYTDSYGAVYYEDPYNFSTAFAPGGGGDGGDYGGSFNDTPIYSTTVYLQVEYIYLGSTTAVASTVDVTPWVDSISPSAFNPGSQTNVTITGGGFGQNPSLDFSPGNGLSYTVMSSTGTSISLVLNVASSASPGARSVDVSSNGASGQGFLSGSSVPTRSNAKSIVVNGTGCSYSIPIDGQKFSIGSDYLTASIPLQVSEPTNSPACAGKVTWSVQFSYHPVRGYPISSSAVLSAGCSTVNKILTFGTPAGAGGQGAIRATIQTANQVVTLTATIYVDGTSIPAALITSRLYSLYSGGATPGLMTGVAMTESTYYHFTQPSAFCYNPPNSSLWGNKILFGQLGSWPNASCSDGGSHIGLMMVQTTMADAYNWQTNTQNGVNLFTNQKLGTAGRYESKFYSCYSGLPPLTLAQSELDALVFYGEAAPTVGTFACTYLAGSGAYWLPNADHTGWVVNNANGVAIKYVNTVQANIQH